MFKTLLLSGLAALALAGCSTYQDVWTPPSTPMGMQCVANCEQQRGFCTMQQQNASMLNSAVAQQCQADFSRAQQSYNVCMAQYPAGRCTAWSQRTTRDASGKETSQTVCTANTYTNPCVAPKPCATPKNDAEACTAGYRACYSSCGGRVDRVEVK